MVAVRGLVKWFRGERGEVHAVDGIDFEVPDGQLFTLLGPSGCGKSTTLRCVAGLEKPDDGEIEIEGRLVFSKGRGIAIPAHQRDIGMVFQSYAIWPHMSVFENVAYPLHIARKFSSREIKAKVERVLSLVKLSGLEDRPAPYLSGGQQQRLAVARALVREPKLLLLDEPLSNLDAKLREHMRLELRELQRQLGITTIYVTHDQLEALALSNSIAVMSDGKIVQIGPPREIYQRPGNRFVADFLGSTNFLPGHLVEEVEAELGKVESPQGTLYCAVPDGLRPGESVLISIRPENIGVHKTRPSAKKNVWEARVEAAAFLGEFLDCQLAVGEHLLRVRAHPSLELRRGDTVFLQIDPQLCIAVPAG